MKLPLQLKKQAEIGKEYILINGGEAAFKTSLFNLSGNADTSRIEPFFPKNEGEVEVKHKTANIDGFLGIACADKGWLAINPKYKEIIENPELNLTTFKTLHDGLYHTSLIISKNDEVVGIIMAVILRGLKEVGQAFDKLNENYNIFKSLTEELNTILEEQEKINVGNRMVTILPNVSSNQIIIDPDIKIEEQSAGYALVNMDNTYSIFINNNGKYIETKYNEPKINVEIAAEVLEKIKEVI